MDATPSSTTAAVLGAFFCTTLSLRLMNTALFPLFDTVMPIARDLGVATGVVANLVIVFAALYRPSLLRERALLVGSLLLCAIGMPAVLASIATGSPALLSLSAVARSLGTTWAAMLTMVACSSLPMRTLLAGIPLTTALAQGCAWAVAQGTQELSLSMLGICPLVAIALSNPHARPTVCRIAAAPPSVDAAITRPSSFLPLTNRIFICQLLVTVVTGFSLRFGTREGAPETALAALVALVVIAIWNQRESSARFDQLFDAGVLLAAGAFLLAPLSDYTPMMLVLLSTGDACFNVVFTLMYLAVVKRNELLGLTVFGWGSVMSSLGSIAGANLGALVGAQQANQAAFLASAAVAAIFLGCVLFGLRGFSFSQTIEGIEPVRPLQPPAPSDDARIERACQHIADVHGLTPRETELLALLGRGRNNQYIQEGLTLTRNTVKTYIKRIYAKLDVHSQQELIDLVERG